jgi:acyl-CoA reductase-like NAD-dependent aldehyde dehydrogenase
MDALVSERFDLRMRVGDMWIDGTQRTSAPVINPATGEVITHVPEATPDDARSALEAAKRAQPAWAALTPRERATYLFSNDARIVQRGAQTIDFGELYVNKIGPEQLNGNHTGYRQSGLQGDDGVHGLEKYYRRRTTYSSWRETTAAQLMPTSVR